MRTRWQRLSLNSPGEPETCPSCCPPDTERSFPGVRVCQSRCCGQNHRRYSIIQTTDVLSSARASGIVLPVADGIYIQFVPLHQRAGPPSVGQPRKTAPPSGTQPPAAVRKCDSWWNVCVMSVWRSTNATGRSINTTVQKQLYVKVPQSKCYLSTSTKVRKHASSRLPNLKPSLCKIIHKYIGVRSTKFPSAMSRLSA